MVADKVLLDPSECGRLPGVFGEQVSFSRFDFLLKFKRLVLWVRLILICEGQFWTRPKVRTAGC